MTVLKETIVRNRMSSISSVVAMAFAIAVLIAFNTPGQVLAQLTPSLTSGPPDTEIEFIGQNSTYPVQNSTGANITQLATLPATGSPIIPASFAPTSEVSDNSNDNDNDNGDDGKDNDHDNGDDGNDNDHDHDNGDDGNDNDRGRGSSSSASAGGGRAFASVG